MYSQKTINEGLNLQSEIINKCNQDENFKKQLLDKPIATLEKFIGRKIDLPQNKVIKVEDQSDDRFVYLNIPPKITVDDLDVELNEKDLEAISGGDFGLTLGIIAGVITLAYALGDMAEGAGRGYSDARN